MARDMTRGGIAKTLALFTGPLILSGLLQQLYNWVDALIVGNFVGESSLAAIGAASAAAMMLLPLLMGFSVGVSVLVAQACGQGDRATVRRASVSFVTIIGVASVVLTAALVPFSRPLLRLLDTPEDIFALSAQYLYIVYFGLPFMALYNIAGAVLRGIGDSKLPLMAIAVSAACNLALDLLFVARFGWGVRGAAAATVLSQATMAVFLLWYALRRYPELRPVPGEPLFDRAVLRRGLRLSLPSALQSGLRSVGHLLLQNVMNSFGSTTVAAITTAYRIDSLALLPVENMGAGISTFAAQNKGADDEDRARRCLKTGTWMAVLTAAAITAFIVPAGAMVMRLFGVGDEAVSIGRTFLLTCGAFYPLYGLLGGFAGFLRGMGDVMFTSVVGISVFGLRIVLSYALKDALGNRIIAVAEIISWILMAAVCIARYLTVYRARNIMKRKEE